MIYYGNETSYNSLMHYGVKGMKWGVRKNRLGLASYRRTVRQNVGTGLGYAGKGIRTAANRSSNKFVKGAGHVVGNKVARLGNNARRYASMGIGQYMVQAFADTLFREPVNTIIDIGLAANGRYDMIKETGHFKDKTRYKDRGYVKGLSV